MHFIEILQEMLESLKALSTFFTENSLRTRRNLRSDIERRSLSINEEFLQSFQGVKEVTFLELTSFMQSHSAFFDES